MLTLLIGTDWTANRNTILQMIAQDVANEKGNRILMVPELISHETERRLCAAAGDTTCRFAEVLSFTRLTGRVSDYSGCGMPECLDNGGRVIAMASVVHQLRSKLKAYAAVETKPEFLAALVDAIDEFKRCCITAKDISRASRASTGIFAQKLEELSLIYDAYDAICQRVKRDPRDQMTWLLAQMEDCSFASNHVFYIDGFPDFTNQHMAILKHMICESEHVTVSLNCDCVSSSALGFEKAGHTAAELLRIAQQFDVPVRIQTIEPNQTPILPVLEKLFHGKTEPIPGIYEHLHVYRTKSVYDECMVAAEKILELIQNGARYREIGVVCTDITVYKNLINQVFNRFKIPMYQAGNDSVLEKSVVATVLAALDVINSGFEQKEVLRYIRSSFSALELQLCDKVENYAVLWSIAGNRWKEDWTNHPDGLSQVWTERSRACLAELNAARKQIVEPLVRLQDGIRKSANLSGQVTAICEFMEQLSIPQRLTELSAEMETFGDKRSAQILNQLWEILLTALEQMYDVLGATVWDSDTFIRLFKLLLSQYEVGTIPTTLDSVMVGAVSSMRCQKVKHLFVLGALEGSMPGYSGSSGVLTDQERTALRRMGISLTGGELEGLQAEFSDIYGVFCGATQSAFVSCPNGQPSFIYKRLAAIANSDDSVVITSGVASVDPAEAGALLARHQAKAAAQALNIKEQFDDYQVKKEHQLGKISQQGIEALYGNCLNLSASQVDKQADCRLAYFLQYGLRAKERKSITVDPAEFGTYVHWVMEQTGRSILERNGFPAVTLEQTLEIAHQHSDAYIQEHFSQIESQRLRYLFSRNVQELDMIVSELWQELQVSGFQPVAFELVFGSGGTLPAIPIPGKTMDAKLRGVVDRVDLWQNEDLSYYRVVDYKTGKKDFDYCDVFNGLGLQMLLYMFALKNEGHAVFNRDAVPVGVQYFPARAPLVSADGVLSAEEAQAARDKLWKRKGLLLQDDAVLEAMEPADTAHRCYTKKRDGTVSGDLADSQQLNQLMAYVFALVGKMVDDISSGCVEPNPYTRGSSHNACAYCPFGTVCNKATVAGRRDYKAMSAQRFWEEIDKEVKKLV